MDVVVMMRPFCLLLPSLRMVGSLDLSGSSTATTGLTCRTPTRITLSICKKSLTGESKDELCADILAIKW